MTIEEDTFASRLRRVREKAGVSAYRLAQMVGLTKQAISRLELGQSKPSWETIQALARALEVPVDTFVIPEPKSHLPAVPVETKKRGRPRKPVDPNAAANVENKPKRPRGRPRNTEE